ncbi:phosphatase PAP2 family protein [Micromonospora musae]|uniref:phosphatase PAP2 family protein n=1 Tax=Micromonospora musae TaxID=1894970 RepID=UPI0033E4B09A
MRQPSPSVSATPLHPPVRPVPVRGSVPAGRAPAARLFRAGLGFLLVFALTAVAFVWTAPGQWLDGGLLPRAERGGGYEQPTGLVDPAKDVLAWFGDPLVLGLLLGGVLLVSVLTGRIRAGLAGTALVGVAVLGAGLAKQVIIRPDLAVATSTTHNSFPSGHVTAAMALLLAVLLVLPARARWWVALPGAVGVSTVAAATMVAGWHRFSDVVGAVLLAAALFCPVAAVLARPRIRAGSGVVDPVDVVLGLVGLLAALPRLFRDAGGLFVAIAGAGGLVLLVVVAVLVVVDPVEFGGSGATAPEADGRESDRRAEPARMINRATSAGMP